MQRSLVPILVAGCLSAVSCSDETQFGGEMFTIAAASRLTGQVTDINGNPLDSVRVFVAMQNTPQTGYASAQAVTNSAGKYIIDVRRMLQFGDAPTPDTVRVEISAQRQKGRYTINNSPIITTTQLLTFSSVIDSPPTKQLDFKY